MSRSVSQAAARPRAPTDSRDAREHSSRIKMSVPRALRPWLRGCPPGCPDCAPPVPTSAPAPDQPPASSRGDLLRRGRQMTGHLPRRRSRLAANELGGQLAQLLETRLLPGLPARCQQRTTAERPGARSGARRIRLRQAVELGHRAPVQLGEPLDALAGLGRDLRRLGCRRSAPTQIELAPARHLDHPRRSTCRRSMAGGPARAMNGGGIVRIDEQAHPCEHARTSARSRNRARARTAHRRVHPRRGARFLDGTCLDTRRGPTGWRVGALRRPPGRGRRVATLYECKQSIGVPPSGLESSLPAHRPTGACEPRLSSRWRMTSRGG